MTQALFLVTRAAGEEGKPMVDGVAAVVINMVSTSTNTQVIAEAVSQLNASKNLAGVGEGDDETVITGSLVGAAPFGPAYFDTVAVLSDLSGGPLNANNICAIFGGVGVEAKVTIFGP